MNNTDNGIPNREKRQEAQQILNILQDSLDDLDRWSAYNEDYLNSEVYEINELIKRARRQLA